MTCSGCGSENPEGSKFCNECGAKLDPVCSQCGTPNPPGSKFCNQCGHNLTSPAATVLPKDLSFDEKLAKIQKYLPGGLTEKILSQRDRIEGERRHVTIMFLDMKGFTPLTEKLGPEETFSLMDKVFELIIHKVHEYEGTVNELRGDGVLAFFGAPIALEDAPQRAIRSSLAIHRELTRSSDKLKSEKNVPPLLVRIGINSGPVVVGTIGNDLRVQFTAVGDTINMAARMEQLAEPGTTYVTEDTFKLTEGYFRFEALGEKEIKGKEKPMRVYQVIAPSTRRTRFDVSAERGLSRFIGRERELELLLDAFERAKEGRGQAVSIVGEAGVGKSRLLYEFRKAVANEDVVFLEGKCLSYGREVAYHPVVDILKANFSVGDGDRDHEIMEKVRKGAEILGVEEATTLSYFYELLSVKDSGIDKIPMSPEGKKDQIMEAFKRIALKGAEIRPLVLAFEDLHWVDTSSEAVLKRLLESIPGSRVLLIFTYRPEFVHTWGGKSYHSQVNLNRLSNRETLLMVGHFLDAQELEKDFEELIVHKTEGVPFFIEEFVRSLRDSRIIKRYGRRWRLAGEVADLAVPGTIQDVVMARVDSLPERAKEVLQIGSVIEREFSYDLIKQVALLSDQELLSRLSLLKDSELLYERGVYPESTYVFKHALTQQVVYDSILTSRKKKLHQEIGNAIENLQGGIEHHYGLLALHFIAGANFEKGAEYARLAADAAERRGSVNDAIAYAEKRVACLAQLPQTANVVQKMIDARTTLGLYMLHMRRMSEARTAIDPAIALALETAHERLSQIYTIIGGYKWWIEDDFPEALKYLEEASRLSDELNNPGSSFFVSLWLGLTLSYNCEFDKAISHLERAIHINVAANNLWGVSASKSSISFAAHFPAGKLDLGYQTSVEALRIAGESGDIDSKARACVSHGTCCYGKGFLDDAMKHLSWGINLCERIDLALWNGLGENCLAEVYFEIAEYQNAYEHYEKAVLLSEEAETNRSWIHLNKIGLEMAKLMYHEKLSNLESLHTYVQDNRVRSFEGRMRKYLGTILLHIDDQHFPEAQHWIEQAIEADERNGMRWHLARDITVYAELFKRKGDREKAKEQLGKAIDIYKECGADGWVTRAEEELAGIS